MNVMEHIGNYVRAISVGTPIFTRDVYNYMKKHIPDVNKALVNVYIARYCVRRGEFKRYKKGIYYKTAKRPFGETGIDDTALIKSMYLYDGDKIIGYETGPSFLNKVGLTNQVPKYTFVATEKSKSLLTDNIRLVKPKTPVTKKNYRYLQLLDMMDNRFKICFESDKVKIFRDYIERFKLDYERLLSYARLYHNIRVYEEIALTAKGGIF